MGPDFRRDDVFLRKGQFKRCAPPVSVVEIVAAESTALFNDVILAQARTHGMQPELAI
jgi:hypothetical protein